MDLVIVSDAFDVMRKDMTLETIASAKRAEKTIETIVVVEKQPVEYPGCVTVHYDFPFNYHKCMNLGIQSTKGNYFAICNNDLIFYYDWATKIVEAMGTEYGSASPFAHNVHVQFWGELKHNIEGYDARSIIAGWCIILKRETYEKIGKLHEGVRFWYSDNIYGEQLKKAGIKHILVHNARVDHLESKTLFAVSHQDLTHDQLENYRKAYAEIWNS